MAQSDGKKSGDRDAKGRFLPGHSKPGPGRKSPHSEAVRAARDAALEVGLPVLCRAAEEGDLTAAVELCRIGLPRLRPLSIVEAVPVSEGAGIGTKAEQIFQAIVAGGLSAETAQVLIAALKALAEATDLADLQARLATMEERTQGKSGVLIVPGVLDAETWLQAAQETQGADNGETVES